jgi:hypothetical protein
VSIEQRVYINVSLLLSRSHGLIPAWSPPPPPAPRSVDRVEEELGAFFSSPDEMAGEFGAPLDKLDAARTDRGSRM